MLYWIYLRCGHDTAQQLLKVEVSVRSKDLVTERLGKKDLTVGELTPEPLWDLLEAGLVAVGLDLEVVSDRLEMEQRLAACYSPARVRTLLGHAVQRQSRSRKQIIKEGEHRQTVSDLENDFKAAGIVSFDMQGKVHLPAVLPLLRALRYGHEPSSKACALDEPPRSGEAQEPTDRTESSSPPGAAQHIASEDAP